jgi:hypothetical protein
MFIQVVQGRATNPPGIRRDLGRWQRQLAAGTDGWLGSTTGITEDGWSLSVIRFASEDHARRNGERPEQREWWRDASQHLARVVFHNARKVHTYRDGGSDSAGFVQIIQGRTDDMERMVSLGRDRNEAPQILGRTLAEHDDRPGEFTQTTYFSSEQDARRAEQEPSELRSLMTNLRSFDLRDPQLLSPTNAPTY